MALKLKLKEFTQESQLNPEFVAFCYKDLKLKYEEEFDFAEDVGETLHNLEALDKEYMLLLNEFFGERIEETTETKEPTVPELKEIKESKGKKERKEKKEKKLKRKHSKKVKKEQKKEQKKKAKEESKEIKEIKIQNSTEEEKCSICFIAWSETLKWTLECNHCLCKTCALRIVETSSNDSLCPFCRRVMVLSAEHSSKDVAQLFQWIEDQKAKTGENKENITNGRPILAVYQFINL